MTTHTSMASTVTMRRAVLVGAGGGVLASLVMAIYAMITGWASGTGFFTPLYHIASLWAAPDSMMASMQAAGAGNAFHFVLGTAVLGAVIHMLTGAVYGAIFGLIVARLHLGIAAFAGIGLVYGFVVFVVSTYIGLPVAAAVFGSGEPIRNMAAMAGWGNFIIEQLLYGLALGVLVGRAAARASTAPAQAGAH